MTIRTLNTNRNEKSTIDLTGQNEWKKYYENLLTEQRVEFREGK